MFGVTKESVTLDYVKVVVVQNGGENWSQIIK